MCACVRVFEWAGSLKSRKPNRAQPRCMQVQLLLQPKGRLSTSLHSTPLTCDTPLPPTGAFCMSYCSLTQVSQSKTGVPPSGQLGPERPSTLREQPSGCCSSCCSSSFLNFSAFVWYGYCFCYYPRLTTRTISP